MIRHVLATAPPYGFAAPCALPALSVPRSLAERLHLSTWPFCRARLHWLHGTAVMPSWLDCHASCSVSLAVSPRRPSLVGRRGTIDRHCCRSTNLIANANVRGLWLGNLSNHTHLLQSGELLEACTGGGATSEHISRDYRTRSIPLYPSISVAVTTPPLVPNFIHRSVRS